MDDNITEAMQRYDDAEGYWATVRENGRADTRFALLGEQWPDDVQQQRGLEGRPCLTINHQPKFIRQVVNDSRQNKPSIKCRPVDSASDMKVAEIYDGIIRHIESTSDADVAYDNAILGAVTFGWGFYRLDIDYANNDAFDLDILFKPILNPMAVLFDPLTQAADSSDWRFAFITDELSKVDFKEQYPGADEVSFEGGDQTLGNEWYGEDTIRIAEYFTRDEVEKTIWKMTDGQVLDEATLEREDVRGPLEMAGIIPTVSRVTKSYKVTHRIITGAEELEKKEWPGCYIPIVPVFGEEINIDGKRLFQSLIYHGKDSQRNFNYWRSAGAELIALAPKAPWVGPEGFTTSDPRKAEKWASANQESHAFLEHANGKPPTRTSFAGVPAGVLQEANMAAEDMREIIGIGNAAVGIPNPRQESGIALKQRRTESDTGTYHFHDNLTRAVRCGGRIVVDLIPKVYNDARVLRILGPDGKHEMVPVNQDMPQPPSQQFPEGRVLKYDLTTGKYDVTVEAGPSYTTKREESAELIATAIKASPQTAPILLPQLVKMTDMPDGDKVTEMLATMMPPAARAIFDGTPPPGPPGPPPEVMIAQQKAQADLQIAQQKAQIDGQLQQQKGSIQIEIERTQAMADMEVERERAAMQMQLKREEHAQDMQLAREKAALDAELTVARAVNSARTPEFN